MKSIIWSPRALRAFRREIRYLDRARFGTGVMLESDVAKAVRHISNLPNAGRSVLGGDLRVWSLTNWKKIIIYQISEDLIEIIAFRDTRQDT